MDFDTARRNMIDSQIITNKVNDDRIIDAMGEVPREVFVGDAQRTIAYVDEALMIGDGRHLMEPMIIGRLLQDAKIKPDDVVLSIGAGTGYAAALLAKLADTVVAVESDKELAKSAQETLLELGIDNVAVMSGDLTRGYPKQAPYDVIFFDGAVEEIPAGIEKQLTEGGRLVAVVMKPGTLLGTAVVVTRYGGSLSRRELFDAGSPLLPGFAKEAAFSF